MTSARRRLARPCQARSRLAYRQGELASALRANLFSAPPIAAELEKRGSARRQFPDVRLGAGVIRQEPSAPERSRPMVATAAPLGGNAIEKLIGRLVNSCALESKADGRLPPRTVALQTARPGFFRKPARQVRLTPVDARRPGVYDWSYGTAAIRVSAALNNLRERDATEGLSLPYGREPRLKEAMCGVCRRARFCARPFEGDSGAGAATGHPAERQLDDVLADEIRDDLAKRLRDKRHQETGGQRLDCHAALESLGRGRLNRRPRLSPAARAAMSCRD
ncbi:MAG: hypothetical protein CFK52_03620 [Chloracidobacterium sp. CP2_5A]|nr:MAG: hypothetical protein CFK52_03620 [Chloracidobacterium sp. CP2_5A]